MTAHVRTAHRRLPRCACGATAPYRCDFEISMGKTCNRPICGGHRVVMGIDRDYCLEHAAPSPQKALFEQP